LSFVDDTVPAFSTGVGQFFPDGSFEEALAAFATVDTVVFAGCPIPANTAEML